MNKKDKEREILFKVYQEKLFDVIEQEEPDFLLKYKSDNSYFGVEITEYYYHGTNARLRNIEGYSLSLLDGGEFLHKKDKTELDVTDITLISNDGTETKVKAIAQKYPPYVENVFKIIDLINIKNKKVSHYVKSVRHLNLIINNTEDFLVNFNREHIFGILFIPELVDMILKTYYKEIFLITRIKDNVYIYIYR